MSANRVTKKLFKRVGTVLSPATTNDTLSMLDANITNVGDIALDSITADDGTGPIVVNDDARINANLSINMAPIASIPIAIKSTGVSSNAILVQESADTTTIFTVGEDGAGNAVVSLKTTAGAEKIALNADDVSFISGGDFVFGSSTTRGSVHIDGRGFGNQNHFEITAADGQSADIMLMIDFNDNILGGFDAIGGAVFNEAGNDADVRIEAVGKVNAFFVQGSDGFVGINTGTPGLDLDILGSGTMGIRTTRIDDAAGAVFLTSRKARGSVGSETAVADNDTIGNYSFTGYDGDQYINAGAIKVQLDGAVSDNVVPGRMTFSTTATNSVTEAVRIDSSQNVGIGVTSISAKLHVDQKSTTAAIPTLILDQADLSEEMVEFITTIGTGNPIEAIGGKSLTTTHFIKVTIPGGLTRYIPCGTIA